MIEIIKEIERMLYTSSVYYPDPKSNIAATFKVTLPEIYYDKFRELNEQQKEIISKFITIFLKKMYDIEKYNNNILNSGIINFKKDNKILLNKQNIMNFFIEKFGNFLNPFTDIKIFDGYSYKAEIKNNEIGKAKFNTFIGNQHEVKGLKTVVMIKISSKYIQVIQDFMFEYKLGISIISVNKIFDLYYSFDIFDGEIILMNNMNENDIIKFNSNENNYEV